MKTYQLWISFFMLLTSVTFSGCEPRSSNGESSRLRGAWDASKSGAASAIKATSDSLAKLNQPEEPMTLVETEPSGAFVEINGSYMGDSPVKISWNKLFADKPHLADAETLVVKAYSKHEGHFTHAKTLDRNIKEGPMAFPPRRIFFDLAVMPMAKSEEE